MFLSRGDRDLGAAFQTHPGRQAFISSGSKEPRSALESRRTRESRRNSRKTTWLPRHRKMKPFPATAPQEKSHGRNWRSNISTIYLELILHETLAYNVFILLVQILWGFTLFRTLGFILQVCLFWLDSRNFPICNWQVDNKWHPVTFHVITGIF